MKLTKQQIDTIIAALTFWEEESMGPHTVRGRGTCEDREVFDLCTLLAGRDVWAVKPQLIENISEKFKELSRLQEQYAELHRAYVDLVQKRCKHEFIPGHPEQGCVKCGKEA